MAHTDHKFITRYGRTFCTECGEHAPTPVRVQTRTAMIDVANLLGVRSDWHEPDGQEVTARVFGSCFDNAGFWPQEPTPSSVNDEMYVELSKSGVIVAQVNLATLFAMACEERAINCGYCV